VPEHLLEQHSPRDAKKCKCHAFLRATTYTLTGTSGRKKKEEAKAAEPSKGNESASTGSPFWVSQGRPQIFWPT
jgi:hypothetical protein